MKDSAGSAPESRPTGVLIIVENLPVPLDRRVWQEATALQQAQISLLAARPTRHPGYWAPFMLISNWM